MPVRRPEEQAPPAVRYSLIGVALVALGLNLWIFRYFLVTAAAATSVAVILSPLNERLCRGFRGRRSLAAAVIIAVTTLTILVPLFGYSTILGRQAIGFYDVVRPHLEPAALSELWNVTLPARFGWFHAFKGWFDFANVETFAPALSRLAAGVNRIAGSAVTGLVSAVVYLLLFLLMLFFFLRDSRVLTADILDLLPFSRSERAEIFDRVARTIKAVLYSMVIVPVVQGLLAMLGFWIFGLPSPLFWGTIVIFAAVIPGVGAPSVWLPAAAYLGFGVAWWKGVGLLLYGTLIIGVADNIIKPILLHETAQIHTLLAFLAILGGLLTFGPVGFLLGPVILSLLLSIVRIYRMSLVPSS